AANAKGAAEYARADFCGECWKKVAKDGAASAWRSKWEPPPAAPEDPIKKASPETLLRSLLEGPEPGNHAAAIYLLSVMLERKRILVERAVHAAPDGTLVHVYEHRKSGDVLLVADPNLGDGEVAGAQEEIEVLLGIRESALPPAATDPATAAPAPDSVPAAPAPEPAPADPAPAAAE
ncbi:MAG: hypothetical protein IJ678_01280, partial [Kiritimatiellae bacterium]|nr:hypothetical protein [Kiritimatiellia bacterium]